MDCSMLEFPALPAKQAKRTQRKVCEILAVGDEPETQGDWEVMSTANRGGPSWRRKTEKGYVITFVVDSGTAKTMAPRNMVPGMKPYKTANTGKNFRVAEGTLIPNEGELRLNGESNQAPLDFKAQVAKVTKPLASTIEMADAGNIVITHKDGGLVKHLTPEGLARVLKAIQSEVGTELVIQRKESTYVFDMEIEAPQPKSRTVTTPMEVGHVGQGNRWAPFWEVEEEEFNCVPCTPFRRLQ